MENKTTRVFFDLEDTVIDTFMDNERFINVGPVRDFLKERNIKNIEIFSRAIWTNRERDHFNKQLRRHFVDILGVHVVGDVPTTEELIRMISKNKKLSLMSREDFFDFFDKFDSFYHLVLFQIIFRNCTNTHFVLVDDMVFTHNIEFPHKNVTIEVINVRDLIDKFMMKEKE